MGLAQALKRIPRIKFPQRHSKSSADSGLQQTQASTINGDVDITFFSSSKAPTTVGGKASLQPRRTPVSSDEIEAILVELSAVELESLRSELADIEEREARLKARLEHIDGILRSARLSGYLYIRTRWPDLAGESASIDHTDVNDWLPRFVVLHGQCIFIYLTSTDLSPQDSTLLSDVVEVGSLASFTREDEEKRYSFYITTRHGPLYECSHVSKIQVDTWLSALQIDYNVVAKSDVSVQNGSSK